MARPWAKKIATIFLSIATFSSPPPGAVRNRFRTAINVLGDALGAGIVYHLSRSELEKLSDADADAEEGEAKKNGDIAANGKMNGGGGHTGAVNTGYEDTSM